MGIDYPELVVFDLDACLWDQEMYTCSAMPSKTVTGDLNGTFSSALFRDTKQNYYRAFHLTRISFTYNLINKIRVGRGRNWSLLWT